MARRPQDPKDDGNVSAGKSGGMFGLIAQQQLEPARYVRASMHFEREERGFKSHAVIVPEHTQLFQENGKNTRPLGNSKNRQSG